jgi:hypothetical protein
MKRAIGLLGVTAMVAAMAGCEQRMVNVGTTPKVGGGTSAAVAAPATAAAMEIVIDNKDAGFKSEGAWTSATGDYFKGEVTWAKKGDEATAKATWTPTIALPGKYEVFEYHGEDPSSDHASKAPFTIVHAGGKAEVAVDLSTKIGKWNSLGTYEFAAGTGGSVTLTNKADNNVIADAVKFVKVK